MKTNKTNQLNLNKYETNGELSENYWSQLRKLIFLRFPYALCCFNLHIFNPLVSGVVTEFNYSSTESTDIAL